MASNLTVPATTVSGNERCWDYFEFNEQSPGSRGMRRYRLIIVNRDGKLAEFRQDMGSAKKFKGCRQIHIPSLWEHTVDELMDLGQELRNEKPRIDLLDWLELERAREV